jgi:hypothetical protein
MLLFSMRFANGSAGKLEVGVIWAGLCSRIYHELEMLRELGLIESNC